MCLRDTRSKLQHAAPPCSGGYILTINTMSHNNPIPIRHRDEFKAHMLRFDRPGASPAMRALELQDASNEFCDMHDKLRFADPVKAVGQYLRMVDQ